MIEYTIGSKIIVDSILILTPIIDAINPKSILVISSKYFSTNTQIRTFIETLHGKIQICEYFSIKANAPTHDLDAIQFSMKKPDLIIGIGGGSVLDSAKVLSICWQKHPVSDYLYHRAQIPAKRIPLILVPTTAGTGSELSYGAIVYDGVTKYKGGIRSSILVPNLVLIDLDLYACAPSKLIAEVGFDCLTHAIETYVSSDSTPIVRFQSINVIKTIFDHLLHAMNGSRGSLEKIAVSAMLMGANLAFSTTCLPHRIQYALASFTEASHAQGLIALYKGWITSISETSNYESLTDDMGISVEEFNGKLFRLIKDLGVDYSLGDYGVTTGDIDQIANKVTGVLDKDPCYRDLETIKKILRDSL